MKAGQSVFILRDLKNFFENLAPALPSIEEIIQSEIDRYVKEQVNVINNPAAFLCSVGK